MKPFALLSFFLLPALSAAADFSASARGTSTAEFLKLGAGARAGAMGQAYSAVADEASALYWNPAALTSIPGASITLMHAGYLDGSYYDYTAYGQNLGGGRAFGLGAQFFSAGQITRTNASGIDDGIARPYDVAVSAAYAYRIPENDFMSGWNEVLFGLNGLSFGLSGKYIESKIETSARTWAIDMGLLSRGYFDDRLRFAAVARNLGGKLTFGRTPESLPLSVTLGSASRLTEDLILSMDLSLPKADRMNGALGLEQRFLNTGSYRFAGRMGYNSETLGSIDGFAGPTAGFGFGVRACSFDYAFAPLGGLGYAHRLSLTLNFGGSPARERIDKIEDRWH